MEKSYTTNLNLPVTDFGLLFLRIAIASLMFSHGLPKLMMLFGPEEISFSDPLGFGPVVTLSLAVFAEVICSLLIGIGLATRLASLILLITMSIAFLVVHSNDAFQTKELALLYLVVYAFITIAGSGKYALDYYFLKK